MKTIEQQISKRCIHFNGIMNDACKAGINYDTVKIGPIKLPCLNQGGHCPNCQFPTDEEVKKRIDEITAAASEAFDAYFIIREHYNKTKEQSGKIDCKCGGKLNYVVASTNGHIWAKCSSCEIAFNE